MYTILFMIGLIWSSGIEGVLHGMNKVGYWFIRISNWNGLEKIFENSYPKELVP